MIVTWDATGRLKPIWNNYGKPPYQRERLAEKVGTSPSVLSAINTGRRELGLPLAQRIVKATKVSLYDLGMPTEESGPPRQPLVLDRLEELAARVIELERSQELILVDLDDARTRLAQLESVRGRPRTSPKRQGSQG